MPRAGGVLAAATVLMVAFGSIHAFSVLLQPLEALTGAGRGRTSLVYALSLVALTMAVLVTPSVERPGARRIVGSACLAAAGGLLLASLAPPLLAVDIGYAVLFGAANGFVYAQALKVAGDAVGDRPAFAMAGVTAAYAVGAALAAPLLERGVAAVGIVGIFRVMAAAFAILALLALALPAAGTDRRSTTSGVTGTAPFWIAYAASVAGGLMVIGHAAPLLAAADPATAPALAAVGVAVGNAAGGLLAGSVADRTRPDRLLAAISLLSVGGLLALAVLPGGIAALCGLAAVGAAYGAHIAIFPGAIRKAFGPASFATAYGRIFTAWGAAGLLAPELAGSLFAATGSYTLPLWLALGMAILGLVANARLPLRPAAP